MPADPNAGFAASIDTLFVGSPGQLSPQQATRARKLLVERAARRVEALNLYEPLPVQADFHSSRSRTNLLRGSNRGGKTLPAAVEVARAVTGQDPHGKYPRTDGRAFLIGRDLKHIGEVIWRKLFYKGAFRMIRDLVSGRWRAYRPWDAADLARAGESRDAPPLIPRRLIVEEAWENKKENVPSKIKLATGWEINFYSSLGKPPRGSDIDLWWFDEEIVDPDWYPEMAARTLDRHGRGIWSATPQSGTEQLYDLHERADRERSTPSPSVREHVVLLAENPHLTDDVKQGLAADLSEEERRVRVGGEFAFISYRVYPEFSTITHVVPSFTVPADWCRYMVVDPGHAICAVLFGAVPPDNHALYLYDELYLQEADALRFGYAVAERTAQQCIEASLIDPHGAAITDIGSGKSVSRQYTDALIANKWAAASTGSGFIFACDNVDAGLMKVHSLLRVNEDARPRLRILRDRCPNLVEEFKRYTKKRVGGVVVDKPNPRKASHLMDCVRYLALHDPRWVKPRPAAKVLSPAVRAIRAKTAARRSRDGRAGVNIGPGK